MKLSKALDSFFESQNVVQCPRKIRKGEKVTLNGVTYTAYLNIAANQSCVVADEYLVPLDSKKQASNGVTTKYRKRRNDKRTTEEKLDLYAGYLFGRPLVFSKFETDPQVQLELLKIWEAYPHTTGYLAVLEVSLWDATRKESVPPKKDVISPVSKIVNYIPIYIPEEGIPNPRRDDEGNPSDAATTRQFSMYYVAPGQSFRETYTNGRTEAEIQAAVNSLRATFPAPVSIPWPHSSGPCLDFAGTLFVDLNAATTFYSTISIPAPIPSFNLTAYTWLFGGQTLGNFQAMCVDGWQNYTDQYVFEYFDLDQPYIVYATSRRYTAETMPSHIYKYGQAYVLPPFSAFTQLETQCPLGAPDGWPPGTPPFIPREQLEANFYKTFCSYSKELKGVLYSLFYYPENGALTEIILGFVPFTPKHPFAGEHSLIEWVNLYQLDLSAVDPVIAEQEYLDAKAIGEQFLIDNPNLDPEILKEAPEYRTWAEKSFIYRFVKYDPNVRLYNPTLLNSGNYPTEAEKIQYDWRTSFAYENLGHSTYLAVSIPEYLGFPESSPRHTFWNLGDLYGFNDNGVSGGYLYNSDRLFFFKKQIPTEFTELDFALGNFPNSSLQLTFNKKFPLVEYAPLDDKVWKASYINTLLFAENTYTIDTPSIPANGILSYTINKLK